MDKKSWYELAEPEKLHSPTLLLYPDRIEKNIQQMIRMAGGTDRLRPHIKTHKMAEIIKMQQEHGIEKFKCATIAEAELLAQCNATDVLLAIQPVAANMFRFFELMKRYPETLFATIADDDGIVDALGDIALKKKTSLNLYLDINVGMNRTGILPDLRAENLGGRIHHNPSLHFAGLHVYDGHIRDPNYEERKLACDTAFASVMALKDRLEKKGIKVQNIVAGGSPTFPIHARRENVETSPGTTLLWDERYATSFIDMDFIPAAVLFSRIISKPGSDILCLDLGHKSIAPEMEFPRARLLGMKDCKQISQSEEHLVVQCASTKSYKVGDVCYAIPMHVCPTVAKYPDAYTIIDGKVAGSWKVAARDHKMSI